MIQIGDTIISRDLIERYFCCDTSQCGGACCIDGDSGAPLDSDEYNLIRQLLPAVWNDLSPAAQAVVNRQGVGYIDIEGDMVTSLVDGRDCVFTCYDNAGVCRCAIEKACIEGRTRFRKPVSCHLYPVRIVRHETFIAVNCDRWHICRSAEIEGERRGVLLYQFLREPLIRRFGGEWYEALDVCAVEYGNKKRFRNHAI